MADTDTADASATSDAAPAAPLTPPEPPTWTPDPNVSYSTRGFLAEDGTQRFYTAEEAAELFPPPPAPTLAEAQAEKVTAINAQFATRLAAGLSYQGQVIDIDDGSRANLSGMALSALLAINKVQAWPDTISRGWVSRSGVRVPLPGPTDGLTLANAAASLYSGLVQHAADLSISVMSATDVATVAAVDETTGWPA